MTTNIRLFQEFHNWNLLASLLNLINLHLFHCRNLTLHWTRSRFHSSSNYLQYRPHVHYRRHLNHLNTSERRCTTNPVVLPLFLCHRTPSKHVAQWVERSEKTSQKMCRCLEEFCSLLYDTTAYVTLQGIWRSIFLCILRLTLGNCAFSTNWLMRYSFVYQSKICYVPYVTESHKRKNLYNMGFTMGYIWPHRK